MEFLQELKSCVRKMIDFAYAIYLDESSEKGVGIAETMADSIMESGALALKIIDEEAGGNL